MNKNKLLNLLHHEVIPATGCTEPVAVSLCVAKACERLRQTIGDSHALPDSIHVDLSRNIYKNAFAVGIPGTGMTGLPIAIALGAVIGRSELKLDLLRDTNAEAVEQAKAYMLRILPHIHVDNNAPDVLYIHAVVVAQGMTASATIQGEHTHFVEDTDEATTAETKSAYGQQQTQTEYMEQDLYSISSLNEVYDFAMNIEADEVRFLMDGAKMNMAAAERSFMGSYGHGLGRMLHSGKMDTVFGNTLFTKILAYTSGACDARMSGAMVTVMSNSGSGNQGISCSVPVYLYALEHNCDEEQVLRALTLSNLTEIYIKQSLGRLSALCGCVVASTGSAVGITYLMGGGYDELTYAIKNMIANISGMICDGAKPGCSLKVTSGVATAVLSASLAIQHSYAQADEGIVEEDIDRTIHNLTQIGHQGMQETDDLIVQIMANKQ
ncbi:MAG: L-serine ammonia-lyase, iron-sulfur-dependent, subunit alpha [Paludibacteraceae bacterium]|nr:L-serine ammonia-lyase, iron-sulfur-dependent, subunit alpha [Paludibacteraceae bacterium]